MFKMSAVCSDTSTEALRPYAIFIPFSRMRHQLTVREMVELLIHKTPDFIPPSLWLANSPDLNPVDYTAWGVPGTILQGEDLACGGVAAAHYGGVGTPRPSCHQQRSKAVV